MLVECKLTGLMYDPDIEFKKILEKPAIKHIFTRLKNFDYELLRGKTRDDIITEMEDFAPREYFEKMDAVDLIDEYYLMCSENPAL